MKSTQKQAELAKIARQIGSCKICRRGKTGKAVPGEGNPNARIVFVGEAPGRQEAATGRPFIGRAGKLLRSLIKSAGLSETEVYITNPVKYLPKRGTPTKADINHGKIHLQKQLDVVSPEIIVVLGRVAQQAFFEKYLPVLKYHGRVIENNGKKCLITIHPSAVLRFPKYKKLLKGDFKKLKKLIRA